MQSMFFVRFVLCKVKANPQQLQTESICFLPGHVPHERVIHLSVKQGFRWVFKLANLISTWRISLQSKTLVIIGTFISPIRTVLFKRTWTELVVLCAELFGHVSVGLWWRACAKHLQLRLAASWHQCKQSFFYLVSWLVVQPNLMKRSPWRQAKNCRVLEVFLILETPVSSLPGKESCGSEVALQFMSDRRIAWLILIRYHFRWGNVR